MDCRPEFIDAVADAINLATEQKVVLRAPLLYRTKDMIAKFGRELDVPYELTWSCYEGGDFHCGRCGTCVERIEAFTLAGVPDPTQYRDREYALSILKEAGKIPS